MSNQNFLTGKQLLNLETPEHQYLIDPIMRTTGTGLIVGVPDTGKSQLVRQLAICIVNGDQQFLGFDLYPKWKRVIFIVTEDDIYSTKDALTKQVGNDMSHTDELKFIFAEGMCTKEIIKILDQTLEKFPSDLVVVDAFGDVFQGLDSNNNIAMRSSIEPFSILAKRHKTFVLFVHHVNKTSYNETPNQKSIQGGSGLTQKVRLALCLSKGTGDIRYLSIIKGNNVSRTHKEMAYEILFDEETLTYKNTGNKISIYNIGQNNKMVKIEKKYTAYKDWLDQVYDGFTELKYNELTKSLSNVSGKSENTIKNHDIKMLLSSNMLVKSDSGLYRRS